MEKSNLILPLTRLVTEPFIRCNPTYLSPHTPSGVLRNFVPSVDQLNRTRQRSGVRSDEPGSIKTVPLPPLRFDEHPQGETQRGVRANPPKG